MGNADFSLGSSYQWNCYSDGNLSVHVSQQVFTNHIISWFGLEACNHVPPMTPYRSGWPIDSTTDPDTDEPDLPKHKASYQSICISNNWLAILTRPDAATILSFLTSYQGSRNHGQYKASLYVIRFIVSTSYFGLVYQSDTPTSTKSFFHFPSNNYTEAYLDTTPPQPNKSQDSTS